ncbi:MAG: 30S ribosomal protein S16 [Proteobacteria bacterium]|jgi:small subunit ribosomal protein S16|nr:30S ribosomal protein S16 [Pseudomonadota bacterium]NBP14966.1 30S ribosomal protein S16 [bacterium]
MAVMIRLARIGKKKAPFFRIVAIDKRSKRDGQYLENLGTYNPLTGELVQFHVEKIEAWLSKGALPSDTVKRLQKQYATSLKAPVAPAATKKVTKVAKVEAQPQEATTKA